MRRLLPLLVVLPLLLAGCGDDEKKEDAKRDARAQKELAAGLYNDHGGDDEAAEVISEDQAACIATEALDSFKLKGLSRIGVLGPDGTYNRRPKNLELADGERWVAALEACVDMRVYLWGLTSTATLVLHPETREMPAAVWSGVEKCVLDGVTEPEASSTLLGSLIGSDAVSAAGLKVDACMGPLTG